MDFTEPLDGTLLTLKQTSLLANEIGVTELIQSHTGLQQNRNSELSSAFYQKLDTIEQIDMTLTGTLPHTHIKSQEKSEGNFRRCVTKPQFLMPESGRKEEDEVDQNQTYNYKISSQSRHIDDRELKCRLTNTDISIPLRKSDKPSDSAQIFCKAADVDQTEFVHRRQQAQTSKSEDETSPVCNVIDMELTSDNKWNQMYYQEVVNTYVGNVEKERPKKQTSNLIDISSHTGIVSDEELRSGIMQNELRNVVQMNGYICDELTSQWPQKQISNPTEVPSHTGNERGIELTSGIKQKETHNAVGVKRYVSDMELRSERPQKQMSHQTDLSSDANVSDMELTSKIMQKGMYNEVQVRNHVNGMELTSEMTQKHISNPTEVSSHVGNVSNMELTYGRKQKETCNAVEAYRYVTDMELTSERPQKQISHQTELSSNDNASDMELTSEIKQKGMGNELEMGKFVNNMELTSDMTQKHLFKQRGVSCLVGNVSNMELTGGRRQKQMYNAVEVNRYVSHLELTSERSQKQISNPTQLSSSGSDSDVEMTSIIQQKGMCTGVEVSKHVSDMDLVSETMWKERSCLADISSHSDVSDMELTSGMKWIKMHKAVEANRYVSHLEVTSERSQKQMSHQTDLSGNSNTIDMELTSGIKQKGMGNEAEVRKYVNNMELTCEMTQKEMSCPVNISNHCDVNDMELTIGMNLQEKRNAAEVNKYITDLELTCEMTGKHIANPIEASSHVGNVSNMELTWGIKRKETCNAVGVKTYVTDMELTSERPQKPISNPTEFSSNSNVSDMELTSRITQEGTGNEVEVRRYINDMELTSEISQKGMSCPVDITIHNDVSDMELTTGMKWKNTYNTAEVNRYVTDKELTSERPLKEISSATGMSSLMSTVTGMKLTSAVKWKEAHNAVETNRYVRDVVLTSEEPQKETFNVLDVPNHGNVSDMELTSGMQWKETHNAVEMNRYVTNMALTSEGSQKEIFNPLDMSSHSNVSDMELTSGMMWKETCKLGEVNQSVTDTEVGSEQRCKQTSSPIEMSSRSNISDMGLRSEVKAKEIYNWGGVSEMEQSDRRESERSAVCTDVNDLELRNKVTQRDMELSKVNLTGIYNQLQAVSKYANSSNTENIQSVHSKQNDIHTETHSETNNISGTATMLVVPKLSFIQTSNTDSTKLSKHKEMGDVAGMSYHSLQPTNTKQSQKVHLLHNNDSEDIKQHSKPEVCISPCGDKNTDKACQSDHVQAKTSLRHIILSEESAVETLESSEFLAHSNSVTLANEMEDKYDLPFSKVTLASSAGRYCEQGISVFEVEGINESGNYRNVGLQVENHIPAKTSVPAVGLNFSNPLNTKKLGEISDECGIPKLNQGSVNRRIKNTDDKSGNSQGKYDLENLDTSSNKVTQVSQMCQTDNSITKEKLSTHQQLSEASTYTFCTNGAIQELAVASDSTDNATSSNINSIGNTASHDIQEVQYTRKCVHEKTHSQEISLQNSYTFKSHNSSSLLLEEEMDGKQGHATNKPASYEYLESSGLHEQTLPELQAFQTVKQLGSITPANSIESVEINQNLSHLQLENMSIPDEMKFNIIRDLSPGSDESYKKLVESVTMADECVRQKVSMTSNESAMLGNCQSTEQNCKDRTSLLEEINNNENTPNETVTGGQKDSPDGTPVKSSSKQMSEQSTPKKLSKDADEDVTIASVEKQIKAEELRLVTDCYLPCNMSDVMAYHIYNPTDRIYVLWYSFFICNLL
jgi:hypothetical protein